jgi:hypothetical protein
MNKILTVIFLILFSNAFAQTQFQVSFPNQKGLLDGRLLLLLSKNDKAEPRFQVFDGHDTQLVFGLTLDNWPSTKTHYMTTGNTFGYPIEALKNIPAGDYYVQVFLHKYETFHRKDGKIVKLPMDRGEGQQWNLAPGNIYSKPVKISINPKSPQSFKVSLDQTIPPIEEPKDTKYIKHIKIQSKLLTEFWGRPMYLGAHVLLPEGFEEKKEVKYPLAIFHGHFPSDFDGFRTTHQMKIYPMITIRDLTFLDTKKLSNRKLMISIKCGLDQISREF